MVTGVVMFIGIVKYKWFDKLLVTSHYEIYESIQGSRKYGNSDCYLYLSLTHQTKRWFKEFLREIVIKIPITGLDPTISFGHVKVIGPEKLWYIRMEYNVLHFSLASTVNLWIDMQLGVETMSA